MASGEVRVLPENGAFRIINAENKAPTIIN